MYYTTGMLIWSDWIQNGFSIAALLHFTICIILFVCVQYKFHSRNSLLHIFYTYYVCHSAWVLQRCSVLSSCSFFGNYFCRRSICQYCNWNVSLNINFLFKEQLHEDKNTLTILLFYWRSAWLSAADNAVLIFYTTAILLMWGSDDYDSYITQV